MYRRGSINLKQRLNHHLFWEVGDTHMYDSAFDQTSDSQCSPVWSFTSDHGNTEHLKIGI